MSAEQPASYLSNDTALTSCLATLSCSLQDFHTATWAGRQAWLAGLQDSYHLGGWFNNVAGILDYFNDSSVFHNSEKMSYADAGVLYVIQEGLASSVSVQSAVVDAEQSTPVRLWKDFFRALFARAPDAVLTGFWGVAEQAGVDYGTAAAGPIPYLYHEQALTDAFVWIGNVYRSGATHEQAILPHPFCVGEGPIVLPYCGVNFSVPDPRTDRQFVHDWAMRVETAVVSTPAWS